MNYLAIKHLHVTFAALSGCLFLLRGFWMLRESPELQRRWVRMLPHAVDTLLLVCAAILVVQSGQYPFVRGWLTAKLLALIAYIAFGTIALKPGRTKSTRLYAFVAALAIYGYIVAVALTKQFI